MMLRPRPTTWFELLTGRDQFACAMQLLGTTGAAELEVQPLAEGSEPVLPRLDEFFETYSALEAKYGPYWPKARGLARLPLDNAIAALEETTDALENWARRADPMVADLRTADAQLSELDLIARLIAAVPDAAPLDRLRDTGAGLLDTTIWLVPEPGTPAPDVEGAVFARFEAQDGVFLIALAPPSIRDAVNSRMAALRATPVPLPTFLTESDTPRGVQLVERRAAVEDQRRTAQAGLDSIAIATELARHLSRVEVLGWLRENAGDIHATKHMMRITGWTTAPDAADIHAAMARGNIDYVVTLGSAPPSDPPLVLDNPRWARAFEFFPSLLGTPEGSAVDPSALTALIAPLLFGFMFGDVGQGAVLVVAGLVLRRRLPFFALLVPGGLAAMVFGLMFGSVFSIEGVIPALWLHPLDAPITLLVAAVALGAVLLVVGIVLDFVQAGWLGARRRWIANNAGLVLAYFGLLAALAWPAAAWALPAGAILTFALARDTNHWSAAAGGIALAEFVEAMMRLLVATVSFARVGAFALAHAGLSAAIVGVGEALGGVGFWVALVFGNLLILALEGLVTGIQTTRLILFEFFIRFFRAEGRAFRPLTVPLPATPIGVTP